MKLEEKRTRTPRKLYDHSDYFGSISPLQIRNNKSNKSSLKDKPNHQSSKTGKKAVINGKKEKDKQKQKQVKNELSEKSDQDNEELESEDNDEDLEDESDNENENYNGIENTDEDEDDDDDDDDEVDNDDEEEESEEEIPTKRSRTRSEASSKTKPKTPTRAQSKTRNKTKVSLKTNINQAEKVLNSIKQSKVNSKPMTGKKALDIAKEKLHASSIPDSLPCREKEFKIIYNFIYESFEAKVGNVMYIAGVPGTGKTATVYEVIKYLKQSIKFRFVEINGLQLTEPYQFYVQFAKDLIGKKLTVNKAMQCLCDIFDNPLTKPEYIVLLVDELDMLKTRKQHIFYHLFDWPARYNSNLCVIAIANSMDMPERIMMTRIVSRLGVKRIPFQPYSFRELQQIVSSRLVDLDILESDALQLVCRKVASVSGDARRVLDICTRAVDLCQTEHNTYVTLDYVNRALEEIFTSPKLVAIRNCSLQQQLFLRAITQEFKIQGTAEAKLINVYKHHIEMCQFDQHYVPDLCQFTQIALDLSSTRLIIIENNFKSNLNRKIKLNINIDDIDFALKMNKN